VNEANLVEPPYSHQFFCVGAVLGFRIILWRISLTMNGLWCGVMARTRRNSFMRWRAAGN